MSNIARSRWKEDVALPDPNETFRNVQKEIERHLEALRALGVCCFCFGHFQPEENNALYGHDACAEEFERESDRRMIRDLIASCPPGTRFDLAGGAACD